MNILKKIFSSKEVKKDVVINNIISVINELNRSVSSINVSSVGFSEIVNYYEEVQPLAHSINIISKEFSNIKLLIKDKDGKFEDSHPVLDLLNKPNSELSGNQFRKLMAVFYLLCGNSFLDASGNVDFPPSSLNILYPQLVSIEQNQNEGYAEFYDYNELGSDIKYKRNVVNGGIRFYESNKLNELLHMKQINPNPNSLFGMIPELPILPEIEQYARSSNHNLALLKNGARLSAMLLKEGVLTDKQYQRLQEQFSSNYQGDSNAGKVMIAESGDGKLDLKELSQSNRDMDFKDNKKDVKLSIYEHHDIPLPLVSPDHMTLSNYSEARLALYDDAVLPATNELLKQLTKFLFPRYDDLEGKELSYNPKNITALETRFNSQIKIKQETGSFTHNEIRKMYEDEPIEGGDILYQPINLVPVGSENAFEPNTPKARFAEILKNNGYSEENVNKAITKYYKD